MIRIKTKCENKYVELLSVLTRIWGNAMTVNYFICDRWYKNNLW